MIHTRARIEKNIKNPLLSIQINETMEQLNFPKDIDNRPNIDFNRDNESR